MAQQERRRRGRTQVMAWINAGMLNPMEFISHTFRFEDILDAFALVERREPGTKRIVIKF